LQAGIVYPGYQSCNYGQVDHYISIGEGYNEPGWILIMHNKHHYLETIGLILVLSLMGCSNHAAAASLQEDTVEFRSNAELTPLSTSEMKLAETPLTIISTVSSPSNRM
jgi:hypothetical protein